MQLEALTVTAKSIAVATRTDPLLAKVMTYVNSGWPDHIPPELKPYCHRKHEITIEGNYSKETSSESIARVESGSSWHQSEAVWWPKLDTDIEAMVKLEL